MYRTDDDLSALCRLARRCLDTEAQVRLASVWLAALDAEAGGISRGGAPPESPDRAAVAAELRRAARDATDPTGDPVGDVGQELGHAASEARQNLPPSELVPVGSLSVSVCGPRVVLGCGDFRVRLGICEAWELRRWLREAALSIVHFRRFRYNENYQ